MDLDLGLEIDGCSYDMDVCPKADSPIVTKKIRENIIPRDGIYRYIEEGSCFVIDAFERLCKGISIPKELAEFMQQNNGGIINIEMIYRLSTEAIAAIQVISDICRSVAGFQECHANVKDTITTIQKRLKDIAVTIRTVSEVYIEKLDSLCCLLEDVMNDVRRELTSTPRLQADLKDEQRNSKREKFRNATAEFEAIRRSDWWEFLKNAGKHLKQCLEMIPESMMGPAAETSESRNEVGVQQSNYQAFHNLNIHLREQEEDHEINLRMSILILEAKSVDLRNAVEFLDNLRSLSVFIGEHEVFYADLPNILCGLCKMSKEEMDSFKLKGISLNVRWVTIQKACADYIESSIMKNFSHEESDSD